MEPYKSTVLFDEVTLPEALRRDHKTKAGVWGVIRLLEGRARLEYADGTPARVLGPRHPGLVAPEQLHRVEPLGAMRMRVDFYASEPVLES